LNPANPPLRVNWIVQFAGTLQAVADEFVGVPKGSGSIVLTGTPAHAGKAIQNIRRRGITFVI